MVSRFEESRQGAHPEGCTQAPTPSAAGPDQSFSGRNATQHNTTQHKHIGDGGTEPRRTGGGPPRRRQADSIRAWCSVDGRGSTRCRQPRGLGQSEGGWRGMRSSTPRSRSAVFQGRSAGPRSAGRRRFDGAGKNTPARIAAGIIRYRMPSGVHVGVRRPRLIARDLCRPRAAGRSILVQRCTAVAIRRRRCPRRFPCPVRPRPLRRRPNAWERELVPRAAGQGGGRRDRGVRGHSNRAPSSRRRG